MTLKLDMTGELVGANERLSTFVIDDEGTLGASHYTLRKVLTQLVNASNAQCHTERAMKEDITAISETLHALEHQIAAVEARVRECEETCQEMRVQVRTMDVMPSSQAQEMKNREADVLKKSQQLDGLAGRVTKMEKTLAKVLSDSDSRMGKFEEQWWRFRDGFNNNCEERFTKVDDMLLALQADFGVLRQTIIEVNMHKAGKTEFEEVALRIDSLMKNTEKNQLMLTEARAQYAKVDCMSELINANKSTMQEMWRSARGEAQDLREWASQCLEGLKQRIRVKMDEATAADQLNGLRKEMREALPHLSAMVSRVKADMLNKADNAEVVRLQERLSDLGKLCENPKQLLVGKKCLACDRSVTSLGVTDQRSQNRDDIPSEGQRNRSQGKRKVLSDWFDVHRGGTTPVGGAGRMLFASDVRDDSDSLLPRTSPGLVRRDRSPPRSAPLPVRTRGSNAAWPATTMRGALGALPNKTIPEGCIDSRRPLKQADSR